MKEKRLLLVLSCPCSFHAVSQNQISFAYDDLDRLVSVQKDDLNVMQMEYSAGGNIEYKTGIGGYYYNSAGKPHAVISVDNEDGAYNNGTLLTHFNDINRIDYIGLDATAERLNFSYGPDEERWFSEYVVNGISKRSVLYAGEYEKITENGTTREFYYLDGNTIVIKQNGSFKPYYAFTDNLGSILSVVDENGTKVFEASYDAWGNQSVALNNIGLHRGYTGHEMLSEFGIINMNGRLYDPVLGRFLSPDNYVQSPYNSQNYNRYTYCLNNPLKYNDPSGELFGLDDVLVIAATFAINYASTSIMNDDWGWSSVGKAAISTACDYFSYGGSNALSFIGKYALNTAAQHVLPSFTVPFSDNFSITFSASAFWGNNGITAGCNMGINYKYKNWAFSLGSGIYNKYSSAFLGIQYKDISFVHGLTNYYATTHNGVEIGAQTVGTYFLKYKKISMTWSNDNSIWTHRKFVGDDGDLHDYDRWRSNAIEFSYSDYSIGTYVLNNDGRKDSQGLHKLDRNCKPDAKKTKSTWVNGQTYLAPLYFGYNDGEISHRFGYSGRLVQHYTQNCVHNLIKCPKFKGYDNLYRGVFSQMCLQNNNYLWGF